jgi:hypothetical protein
MSTDSTNPAVDAVPKLILVLQPLSVEDRQRAITATMILLGHANTPSSTLKSPLEALTPHAGDGLAGKALAWMSKNSITREQLDHIFSIDNDSIDVIASKMPGSSKRQQTVEAFVMCGLKSFLHTGEPSFTDKDARELCLKVGCYDTANHSNYMKAFGNFLAGSKEGGWKLTNPGLSEAVKIVRALKPGGE